MTAGRLALALLVVAALACRAPRPERPEGSCTHVQAIRQLHGEPLCEDVWTCSRPPRGQFDRIGLRRVARCDGATGPVVLYLPGMHMNAELPLVEPRHDLRLYLAEERVRAWGLDYRTHAVPPDASPADLRALDGWTVDRFVDDVAWATAFVRGADPGPLFVAGFSQGAVFAYRLASRRDAALAGLLILDGAPNTGPVVAGGGPAIDVGGSRLPFAERRRLLDQVIADANAPSPLPGFPTAGAALASILSTAPLFGREGGLAAGARVSEISVLAVLLRSYDRWWPRAAVGGPSPRPPKTPLPVLAFASTNMGPAWVDRVRAAALAYGGPEAEVRELAGYGHLDVLVARRAAQDVFQPALAWLGRRAGR
ncbi:MAG: alpha/beta hydrolase [Deltaproteobacteria bacterium]|nr:MAG: alpha/beta hydrolase [Deltaproteobacteria bacterium]TMA56436.1 MAG: alpha/beta hydrolase [Deltaproteobacteria bacterium]